VDLLDSMVECALPRMSSDSRRVVRALVAARGSVHQANSFARSIGLRNRDQLRRILTADGLPCLEDLAAWIRILGWVLDSESSGAALSHQALSAGRDPRSCYKTVTRLTGRTWGQVRLLGSAWVLMQFALTTESPTTKEQPVRLDSIGKLGGC
jgi:hypothetical protein